MFDNWDKDRCILLNWSTPRPMINMFNNNNFIKYDSLYIKTYIKNNIKNNGLIILNKLNIFDCDIIDIIIEFI